MAVKVIVGLRQGVAGAMLVRDCAAAATTVVAAVVGTATAVGPLAQPSLKSHSRGTLLLSFLNDS